MHFWLFREPSLCWGFPVYICATVVFPLHLGWTGTSLLSFAGYLLVAAVLFSIADALLHPSFYPRWLAIVPQSMLSLLALLLPAALTFAAGAALGPVEEELEDQVCAASGSAETNTSSSEADDTFDMTADCALD